jgi:hypothetical protein
MGVERPQPGDRQELPLGDLVESSEEKNVSLMPSETGEGDWRFDFVDAVCFESLFPKKLDHTLCAALARVARPSLHDREAGQVSRADAEGIAFLQQGRRSLA